MKPLSYFISLMISSAAAIAGANEPQVSKDWMVLKGADEVFGKEACLAGTKISTGTNRAELSLSFTTDRATVPQLLVKVWDQPLAEEKLFIKVSSKIRYPVFLWKKAAAADQPHIYWYAPIGWSPLMDYVAAANNLSVTGESTQVSFSLKGSSVTLGRVEKCLQAQEILPKDFLKKLNAKTETPATVLATVDEMISENEKTFEAYRQGITATKELQDLLKGSSRQIKQEQGLLEEMNTALRRLNRAEEALKVELTNKSQLEAQLVQAQSDLKSFEEQLGPAQQIESQKKAVYEPLRKQLQPAINEVVALVDAVERNEREERQLRNAVANAQSHLSNLESQKNSLSSEISSLDWRVDQSRRDYERAREQADRYDVDREIRNDFDHHRIERARDEGREADRRVGQTQGRLQSARDEQRQVREELDRCLQEAPGTCQSIRQRLADKRSATERLEQEIENARNEARNHYQRADRIQDEIRRKHQAHKQNLRFTADREYDKYRQVSSSLDRARNQYDAVVREIPSAQSEISRQQSRLRSVRNEKPGLESSLASARKKRDDLKKQIGFDVAEAEYEASQARVEEIESGISKSKSLITKTEKALQKSSQELVGLNKEVDAKKVTYQKSLEKLAPVQEALKPVREKEALLQTQINSLAVGFETGKALYQRTYESWIQPNQMIPILQSIGPIDIGTF